MRVHCSTLLFLALLYKGLHCNDQVGFLIETNGYPSFYKDEPITMTCTASGENAISAVYLVNGVKITDPRTACRYDDFVNKWLATNVMNIPGVSTIDQVYCITAATAAPPFILSVTGTVTDDMLGANFRCFADSNTRFNSTTVSISSIAVKPGNIQLNRPSRIVEGKEFAFGCSSTGGSPASVYDYEVLRGDAFIADANTYTPVKADREGLTLRCKDTVHAALTDVYPNLIIASEEVRPRYIDQEETLIISIENTTASLTLSCPVLSNPYPSYNWTCSKGCSGTFTTKLVIPANSRENGQVETIRCTAAIDSLSPVTVTFGIIWKDPTSLLTTPQGTTLKTENQTNSPALAPGIVAGVLAIGLVVQTVIFCWWKRRIGMSGIDKKYAGTSQPFGTTSHDHQNHPPTTDRKGDNYESLVLQSTEDHPYSAVTLDQPYENMERKQHVLNTAT